MTNDQLKKLEDKLWDSANALRAYGGMSLHTEDHGRGQSQYEACVELDDQQQDIAKQWRANVALWRGGDLL